MKSHTDAKMTVSLHNFAGAYAAPTAQVTVKHQNGQTDLISYIATLRFRDIFYKAPYGLVILNPELSHSTYAHVQPHPQKKVVTISSP